MRVVLSIWVFTFSFLSYSQLHGWDSNVYLPGLGRDDAVCFTLDEIVFIGTGNHGGFSESNTFYALNTRSGQWQDVAPFPGTARQYAITEEIGFKAYLIGGIDLNNNPLNDVWEYDLINDTWNQLADFPGGARWKTSSFMINQKIYYGTGRDWNQSFNDLWEYNPDTDTWKQVNSMPVLPRDETVAFSIYERGFVGLGIDCTGVLQQDIWKYDPFADEWNYETEFPGGPRWYAIAEVLNGKAYVGTGEDDQANMHNDFWRYDPAEKQWEQAENLPNPARRGTAACTIPFKGIFVVGGLDDSFQRLTDVSRYTYREQNPVPLRVYFQFDEHKVYIHDLPYYTRIRVTDIAGNLQFETDERIDHLMIDVTNWSQGVYVVSAGSKSAKFLVH